MLTNRMFIYLAVAAGVALMLGASGFRLATLIPFAVLLACPLGMIVMMRGMGRRRGMHGDRGENQTGQGSDHDPAGEVKPPASRPS